MPASSRAHTIEDLMAEGFSRRTISYYVGLGVLPRALSAGKYAYYTDQHIKILRDIKAAQDERRELADIADHWHRHAPHLFEREPRGGES